MVIQSKETFNFPIRGKACIVFPDLKKDELKLDFKGRYAECEYVAIK